MYCLQQLFCILINVAIFKASTPDPNINIGLDLENVQQENSNEEAVHSALVSEIENYPEEIATETTQSTIKKYKKKQIHAKMNLATENKISTIKTLKENIDRKEQQTVTGNSETPVDDLGNGREIVNDSYDDVERFIIRSDNENDNGKKNFRTQKWQKKENAESNIDELENNYKEMDTNQKSKRNENKQTVVTKYIKYFLYKTTPKSRRSSNKRRYQIANNLKQDSEIGTNNNNIINNQTLPNQSEYGKNLDQRFYDEIQNVIKKVKIWHQETIQTIKDKSVISPQWHEEIQNGFGNKVVHALIKAKQKLASKTKTTIPTGKMETSELYIRP